MSGRPSLRDISSRFQDWWTEGRAKAVTMEAIASQLPGRENGPADAYRHILIAAELTRVYGENTASLLLWGHEALDLYGTSNSAMDVHNNEIGIAIGNYVRSSGGGWLHVKLIARELVSKSLSGESPQNIQDNWVTKTDADTGKSI